MRSQGHKLSVEVEPADKARVSSLASRELEITPFFESKSVVQSLLNLSVGLSPDGGGDMPGRVAVDMNKKWNGRSLEFRPEVGVGYPVTDIVIVENSEIASFDLESDGFKQIDSLIPDYHFLALEGVNTTTGKTTVVEPYLRSPRVFVKRSIGGEPVVSLALIYCGSGKFAEKSLDGWSVVPYNLGDTSTGYVFLGYKKFLTREIRLL